MKTPGLFYELIFIFLLSLSVLSILGEFNVIFFLMCLVFCIFSVPVYVILGMEKSNKVDAV
jgi:hypothetical protein